MAYNTYQGIKGVSLEAPKTQVLSDENYFAKAVKQYDQAYNTKVQGLQGALQRNLSNLEGSKATIDSNYDRAVDNQNLNNQVARNNLNNDSLTRGLGRSSIVTSGLASADLANNRMLAGIQGEKTTALNNVSLQQANASADNQNQLNIMAANRLDETQTLADKLKDTDINRYNSELAANRNYYMQQLGYNNNVNQMNDSNFWKDNEQNNWQKSFDNNNYWKGVEQSNWQNSFDSDNSWKEKNYDFKNKKLEMSNNGSGKGQQNEIDNAAVANFNSLKTPQDQLQILNDPDFIKHVSPSVYKQLYKQYQESLENSGMSQSLVEASQPTWNYSGSQASIYSGGR